MNEHSFIDAVHRKLPASSADFLKWKINDRFAGGTADAYYACDTGDLWVEYKYEPKYPKKGTTQLPINLAELQLLWLERQHRFRGNAVVIVGCENDALILTEPAEWRKGWTKDEFQKRAIKRKDIPSWIMDRISGTSGS